MPFLSFFLNKAFIPSYRRSAQGQSLLAQQFSAQQLSTEQTMGNVFIASIRCLRKPLCSRALQTEELEQEQTSQADYLCYLNRAFHWCRRKPPTEIKCPQVSVWQPEQPRFEVIDCHLSSVWPWAIHLANSLVLSFPLVGCGKRRGTDETEPHLTNTMFPAWYTF